MAKQILIPLADGHEEIEALTQVDLLRRAGIGVTLAGLNKREITGAHEIIVKTDILFDQVDSDYAALILPGGNPGTSNLNESTNVIQLVREFNNQGKLCAAICAAPLVFETAGILVNRSFTCYPGVETNITNGRFLPQSVVIDQNIITSRGVGTAIPFALAIIAYLIDNNKANEIAQAIVFTNPETSHHY